MNLLPCISYGRVSTPKQAREGHGLEAQETRSRDHARNIGGYIEVGFSDDITGGGDFMKRPGMVALLKYLDDHPDKSYVVIFDDLKRFARDTEFHLKLRRELNKRNARVECPNFKFEDTPEGTFVEVVLAAEAQLEREQHARQVKQKMLARTKNGYWCFKPPTGYKYENVAGHGKLLVPTEPLAPIVTEAIEGFAFGRLGCPVEVQRFLASHTAFPRNLKGEVLVQRAIDLLTEPLYAGYITVPKWGIFLLPGKHEPLVSAETWHLAQQNYADNRKTPASKNLDEDFPLRGFVVCGQCLKPMTACWSQGQTRKYPYYYCAQAGCSERYKMIAKELIEGDFSSLLQGLAPSDELTSMAFEMLKDLWDGRSRSSCEEAAKDEARVHFIERKIGQLAERILASDSNDVIMAYETEIEKLGKEKALLRSRAAASQHPPATFAETFRTAMSFLAQPWKLWDSNDLSDKRLVLRLVFSGKLSYARNEGFRTAEKSLPFKTLEAISQTNSGLVEALGFEPRSR